jgi:hypothetical protein
MLIISISFILLPKRRKQNCIHNIYRYIVKNIKKTGFFFYIVREENIRPQVLRDKISPPFFQHYEKKYHIISLAIIYSLSIGYHHKMTKKKSIIDLVLHCICMTVVPCNKGFERFFVSLILQNICILPTSAENGLE